MRKAPTDLVGSSPKAPQESYFILPTILAFILRENQTMGSGV